MALTILTDLDGTLLPRPYSAGSTVVHPNLSIGPAYAPLCRLLSLGCTVVGVTGSALATHQIRFFDDLPLEFRKAGQVLLAVQTGLRLYTASADTGEPEEDSAFAAALAGQFSLSIEPSVVEILIEAGRAGIRAFYKDLASTPALVPADGPLGYLHECNTDEIPVTQDNHRCPRIEVRNGNSAVVFVGVPSALGAKYFSVPTAAEHAVEGRPAGRACFDCVPKGLDKSHCVSHLLKRGAVVAGRAIAMGDQPKGNDEGLTRWHRHATVDIPFVSVSEYASMVPEHLAECHVTAASNAEGSALVLGALADLLEAGTIELSSDAVSTLVRDLNRGDLNRGASEGRGGMM